MVILAVTGVLTTVPRYQMPAYRRQHVTKESANSRSLEERITAMNGRDTRPIQKPLQSRLSTPPPPLINRISPYENNLRFHKTKILLRIQEMDKVLRATRNRLEPIMQEVQWDDNREDFGRDQPIV